MKIRPILAATAIVLFVLPAPSPLAQWPFGAGADDKPTLAPLLKRITPAVVNISVVSRTRIARNPLLDDPFFRRFFDFPEQPYEVPRQSVGSGVIVDVANGYVLTNHHVIANADEIIVTLTDRRRLEAELVGSDEGTDIALLRIDADALTAITFGNSGELEVGDFVVAIGNPFGLGQTVTSGIVSALGRTGLNIEGYEDFIQTDASINPGNSGGALVDLDGRLIGINTAIVSPAGGNVGIGFAVPSNMAREVMTQLIEYGEVRRGRLGINIQDVTPDLSEALDLDVTSGAVVTQVEPDSTAERAGLQAGDVIVEFNGEPVQGSADLRVKVGLVPVGSTVEIGFYRDGRLRNVTATISGGAAAVADARANVAQLQGAELANIGPNHPRYGSIEGVLVARVEQGSRAARNGLRDGDVILAVNRTPVRAVEELTRVLGGVNGAIALDVIRGNARLFIVIQ